jgi:hypothetical protein
MTNRVANEDLDFMAFAGKAEVKRREIGGVTDP